MERKKMVKNELNLPQECINTFYASFSKATRSLWKKNKLFQSILEPRNLSAVVDLQI